MFWPVKLAVERNRARRRERGEGPVRSRANQRREDRSGLCHYAAEARDLRSHLGERRARARRIGRRRHSLLPERVRDLDVLRGVGCAVCQNRECVLAATGRSERIDRLEGGGVFRSTRRSIGGGGSFFGGARLAADGSEEIDCPLR